MYKLLSYTGVQIVVIQVYTLFLIQIHRLWSTFCTDVHIYNWFSKHCANNYHPRLILVNKSPCIKHCQSDNGPSEVVVVISQKCLSVSLLCRHTHILLLLGVVLIHHHLCKLGVTLQLGLNVTFQLFVLLCTFPHLVCTALH